MTIRQGKVICTGKGGAQAPHKRRDFGAYMASESGFWIYQKDGALNRRNDERGTWRFPPMQSVRFRCPTCRRDMRFRSEDLLAFLLDAAAASENRDLSVLAATLGSA